ncbi:hypothetical protein U4960_07950 [Altererythrobacter sp. H2]|uniref:hypothetical protein n=1 Tax=Altererythrobacter sp. H2 TaxID=3108391 RepID=UPI002B4C1DC3|nr:hypothetical protein [Altererythrobacter sp. H2]WRK97236.1 hypothetical protein U4960_07950 [Altererythrobacter sp. H2]
MRLAFPVAVSLILALAACGSEQSGTFEDGEGGEGTYRVDEESGVTTSEIKTEEGTARMESGAGVKANLPDGFALMPGANVISASNITTEQGSGSMTMMEIGKPADEVVAFYRKQAEAAGVKIQLEMNSDGTRMIGGEGRDGVTFSLTATEADGKTSAQLMVGSK